jgi:hypothetical protein
MKVRNTSPIETKPGNHDLEGIFVVGNHCKPCYPVGTIFDVEYRSTSGRMEIKDSFGIKLLILSEQAKYFEDVEN